MRRNSLVQLHVTAKWLGCACLECVVYNEKKLGLATFVKSLLSGSRYFRGFVTFGGEGGGALLSGVLTFGGPLLSGIRYFRGVVTYRGVVTFGGGGGGSLLRGVVTFEEPLLSGSRYYWGVVPYRDSLLTGESLITGGRYLRGSR